MRETCECPKKEFDLAYRCERTNHILCHKCDRPFESLARFKCTMCGHPSINTNFHEFNLFKDYDSSGNLLTHLACEACFD